MSAKTPDIDFSKLQQIWNAERQYAPELGYISYDGLRKLHDAIPPENQRADIAKFLEENPVPVPGTVVFISTSQVGFMKVEE